MHGNILILLWIDFLIGYKLSKKDNIKYSFLYLFIYNIFNLIYVKITGNIIYPILRWNDYVSVFSIFIGNILLFIVHHVLLPKINLIKIRMI